MNMLRNNQGDINIRDLLLMGVLVLFAAITAFLIINLNVYRTLFLFATGLLSILTFANITFGLFFIIIFMFFPNLMPREMFGIVGINPFNLIFVAVVCAVVLQVIIRHSKVSFSEPIYLPLLLLFALQTIAIIRFQNAANLTTLNNVAWLTHYFKPMQYIILMFLVVNFVRSKQIPILCVIILGGFIAAGGILFNEWLHYGFAVAFNMTKNVTHVLWANPLLGHKNNWGSMFALVFFFALALTGQKFNSWKWLLKYLTIFSLFFFGFLVALSLSRSAYICLTIGIMYFYWKKGRFQFLGIVIALALIVLILPDVVRMRAIQDIPTSWNTDTINQLFAGRLKDRWLPAAKSFIENPLFGRGFNGAGIYMLGQAQIISPHSGYSGTLCDMGIIGLAVMIWVFVTFWRHCSMIHANTKFPPTRRLALACKTQILILAVSNLAGDNSLFYRPVVLTPFFMAVAILFALYREESSQRDAEIQALPNVAAVTSSQEQIPLYVK
jgi:O-antigen ligase